MSFLGSLAKPPSGKAGRLKEPPQIILPNDYNPRPLYPIIRIFDNKMREQYVWEHQRLIGEDSRQDFILNDWQFSIGICSDAGNCVLTIEDDDALLTNEGIGTPLIRPGFHVQISLGKDPAGIEP